MSIATMKKKSLQKYNVMSTGYKNFSINGAYRNQGWVGQTTLSRSLPKTLMNGPTERGHGGCCGTYRITPIVTSAVYSTNNNTVIKSSVLSYDGMIATQFRWIRRPQPYTSVKPDTNHNLNNQSDYINRLTRSTSAPSCTSNPNAYQLSQQQQPCNSCKINPSLFKNYINTPQSFSQPYPNSITKPDSDFVPISEGEYLVQLTGSCTQADVEFQALQNLSSSNCNIPYACNTKVN